MMIERFHFVSILLLRIIRYAPTVSLLLFLSSEHLTSADNSPPDQPNNEMQNSNIEFVATNEWQQVLPGQHVPPGLHIRMNLETGVREAKLLDEVEKENGNGMVVVAPDETDNLESETDEASMSAEDLDSKQEKASAEIKNSETNWNAEKIYDVLQGLPEPPRVEGMDLAEARSKLSTREFKREIIRLWKKRQEILKEAFESMQDDSKFLADLIDQLRNAKNLQGKLNVLEKLEWEVQDLDKSRVFHYIGGFEIITEYLDAEDLRIAAFASWVIGSACKNFNEAQKWAVEAGAVPRLINLLLKDEEAYSQKNDQLDAFWECKKKALYAISSVIRAEELSQHYFLQHKGVTALLSMLEDNVPYSLKLKVILLVHDILLEALATKDLSARPALTRLTDAFKASEWCERISAFLLASKEKLRASHIIETMITLTQLVDSCHSLFSEKHMTTELENLVATWRSNSKLAEDPDELRRMEMALRGYHDALALQNAVKDEL